MYAVRDVSLSYVQKMFYGMLSSYASQGLDVSSLFVQIIRKCSYKIIII